MALTSACEVSTPRLFGLAADGVDAAAVEKARATARSLDKHLDVLNFYEAFAYEQPLPTELLGVITAAGAVPEITWEPWNPDDGPNQPAYSPGQIAGGRHDAYITRWAKAVAKYNGRLLVRFAHEMNGNWYPWSVSGQAGSPEDYVAAYRRVHRIFEDVGAKRVEWVWSPNVIINGDTNTITRSYPGDEFVDIIGVDGYNFGDVAGHHWTQPTDLFAPTLQLVGSITRKKPVWINEVGTGDSGGDKAQWITDFVEFLMTTAVRGLLWFEADNDGQPDWRLTATPQTIAAAKGALAKW